VTIAQFQTTHEPAVKNIVLVHGAWADGSCWSRVIPLLTRQGFHVVAVQNPLTSFADDVAATERALASLDGPVILVGHSYGGAVITQAGNDPKVVALVYVAAFAPDAGQSAQSLSASYPPAPLNAQLQLDTYGFLTITPRGIGEDFAQDLSDLEKLELTVTQGPTAAAALSTNVTQAAWRSKPSWLVIAGDDRAIPPALEMAEAAEMNATAITVPSSSHVVMLSHPLVVSRMIEQAAADSQH
jgi:pimeloyl-ACP methyl ester carboxylesterase